MPNREITYTYRGGKKIPLEKRLDQFVVAAQPDRLKAIGFEHAEQVSSTSCRVTIPEVELEAAMERSRGLAPTHHAYYHADTGKEFVPSTRILVSFDHALPSDEVDTFAGRYGLIKRTVYGDRDYLFELTNHTSMNPVKLVVKLNENEPLVKSAEHDLNQRMKKYQFTLPTDPDYARQWHLHTRFGHADLDPRSSSRCEEAWRLLNHFGKCRRRGGSDGRRMQAGSS